MPLKSDISNGRPAASPSRPLFISAVAAHWSGCWGRCSSELKKASVRGLDGRRIDLAAPAGGATVLIFYSTECPISNSYSPTLATLASSFPAGVGQMAGRVRRS